MIRVNGVTKKFGKFTAVEKLSFNVENGSVYGLVGYNSAYTRLSRSCHSFRIR